MLTQDEARTRVAKGAAHLDQVRPGWFNRIDIGTLTLHDPCGCIVGQLCHTGSRFSRGLDKIGIADYDESVTFGFAVSQYHLDCACSSTDIRADRCPAYRLLQDAWIEAIADRRLRNVEAAQAMDHPASVAALDAVGVRG